MLVLCIHGFRTCYGCLCEGAGNFQYSLMVEVASIVEGFDRSRVLMLVFVALSSHRSSMSQSL